MTKEEYQRLFLNKENEMLACLMYGSLISSDTLRSVEACEKSKEELLNIQEALKDAPDSEEKELWIEMAETGIAICDRDRAEFELRSTPEYQERMRAEEEERQRHIEEIKLTKEYLHWKPLYPNNMPCNDLVGCYALLFARQGDGSLFCCKWTIGFQQAEIEPGTVSDAKPEIDAYILHRQIYHKLEAPFQYPEPSDYSAWDNDEEKPGKPASRYGVNDYGEFVRAYKTIEEAEKGALARCLWLGINKETIVTINKKRKK